MNSDELFSTTSQKSIFCSCVLHQWSCIILDALVTTRHSSHLMNSLWFNVKTIFYCARNGWSMFFTIKLASTLKYRLICINDHLSTVRTAERAHNKYISHNLGTGPHVFPLLMWLCTLSSPVTSSPLLSFWKSSEILWKASHSLWTASERFGKASDKLT